MLLWFVKTVGFRETLSLVTGVAVFVWSFRTVSRAREARDVRPFHPLLLGPLVPGLTGVPGRCLATLETLSISGLPPSLAETVLYVVSSFWNQLLGDAALLAPAFLTLLIGRWIRSCHRRSSDLQERAQTRA